MAHSSAIELSHIDADRSASDWPRLSQARNEARSLFLLVETGSDTADHVRELIRVPASVKRTLTAYVARYPRERFVIERTLHFREQVLLKFERLLRPDQREHRHGRSSGAESGTLSVRSKVAASMDLVDRFGKISRALS